MGRRILCGTMPRLLLLALVPLRLVSAQSLATSLAPSPTSSATPSATRVVLDVQLRAELTAQRIVWQAEELRVHGLTRHPQQTEPEMQRLAMLHCHTDRFYAPSASLLAVPRGVQSMQRQAPAYPLPTLIASTAYKTAICPSWSVLPIDDSPLSGPSHLEASATPALVQPFSDELVTALDTASLAHPDEPWFTRQLVRVLVDNGAAARAVAATDRCGANGVAWCALLQTYALYRAGDAPRASRVYHRALAMLDAPTRCHYRSVELLLPPADAEVYSGLACAARDTVDATIWWLSTPLFADGANLRELEHVSRLLRDELASDMPFDAHYDLHLATGGDAVREMRVRYGWPQHLFWPGDEEDRSHWRYQESNNAPPFSAAEYSRLNIPALVSWRAILKPGTLSDADYLWAPSALPTRSPTRSYVMMAAEKAWWPREFFLHPRGAMVRIAETQHVALRRDSGALVVVGAALPAGISAAEAWLMHSPAPSAVSRLDRQPNRRGERLVVQGMAREPGVLSVELLGNGPNAGSARTRFQLGPDAFRTLPVTGCAVSEPMLLDAALGLTNGFADVEAGLLPSTRLSRPSRLGVAWESYGFRERDSVTISVRIAGSATQTRLEKTGRLLRVGDDPRVGLTMRWTEPNPAHAVTAVDATTPTLLRELALDISALRAGAYQLQITMERAGCAAATSQRAFSVVR
jgi:hypothetical protein